MRIIKLKFEVLYKWTVFFSPYFSSSDLKNLDESGYISEGINPTDVTLPSDSRAARCADSHR